MASKAKGARTLHPLPERVEAFRCVSCVSSQDGHMGGRARADAIGGGGGLMLLLVSGATKYPRDEAVGHLIVPGSWNVPQSLGLQRRRWAMDNGAFGGAFDAGQFVTMLEAFAGEPGCLFVATPDVIYKSGIGDAAATLRKWPFWARLIRGLGFPPAFVAQDGLTHQRVPWTELEAGGALFVGGSTTFKEGPLARSLMGYAKARGIWVHVGRVNGQRRYRMMVDAGADSIDGTGFSRHPDTNIPLVDEWQRAHEAQPTLLV